MLKNSIILFFFFPLIIYSQKVENLQCNYNRNPFSVDDRTPQLSWNIISTVRGDRQTAYEILVSSTARLLSLNKGDVWHSDKILSGQNLYINYAGKELKSRKKYYWKVRVWNKDHKASPWSQSASWTMGLLTPSDWTATWITASKWFYPLAYRSKGLEIDLTGGWADVDLGAPFPIDKIKLYPYSKESFPVRFRIEASNDLHFHHPAILVDYSLKDYDLKDFGANEFVLHNIKARYIRLNIFGDTSKKGFVVRQMEVISDGKNIALMKFTREMGTKWNRGHAVFLVDGMPSQESGNTSPADACPITTAPIFRKSVTLNKSIKQATLYVAALGMAEITINGQKAGDQELGPPFSDYYKRVIYETHNVTGHFRKGENVIGAILANGFFSPPGKGFGQRHSGNGPPQLLLQTEIEFTDGSKQIIVSDKSWQWERSEIIFNDLWMGYTEDRHYEKPGWNKPGYTATDWKQVSLANAPPGKLCASMAPPIRITGIKKPYKVEDNHAFFDVVTVGWPQVKINGKAGQTVYITGKGPGFTIPTLTFTLAKDGLTTLHPRFIVFSGPTDIQVDGLLEPLTADAVNIQLVNADLPLAGSFTSSNNYLNNLFEVTMRTHRNYILDYPADPTREKQGWTQDAQNMFNTAANFTDVRGLYQRFWWDMADNQDEQGYVGSVVPMVNRQVYDWNSPWWSGALVFLPWEHYKYYGNKRILEQAFEPMQRYVDLLGRMAKYGEGKIWYQYPFFNSDLDTLAAKEQMIIWNGAGDWQNPYTTSQFAVPAPMTTMPAYYNYAMIVSKTASLLNKHVIEKKYADLAAEVKTRFNAKYFNSQTGLYGDSSNSQTGQVLPLAVGLVPTGKEDLTYKRMIDTIHTRGDHIGAGFVALSFLLHTLASNRETALANIMVNQKDYPSWNTLIKNGVLLETWKGGGAQMPSCGGQIGAWLFESVLGIIPDTSSPGFKKFIIAPQPDTATGLTSATGYYDSVYGRITSEWKYDNNVFTLHATVPVNTTATITIPAKQTEVITESGLPVNQSKGLTVLKAGKNLITFLAGSGDYYFKCRH